MKIFIMKKPILVLLCFWIFMCFWSCSKDIDESPDGIISLLPTNNGVSLSYNVKTIKYTRLVNPQDSSILTNSEKTLLVPEIRKANVVFEMDTLGNFAGEIIMLPTEPIYPKNVIGRRVTPENLKVARKEFSSSGINYYNSQDNIISAEPFCQRLANYYVHLSNNLSEEVLLSPQDFDLVMDAWKDAGFHVVDNGPDYSSIKFDLQGGNYSYVLIDRNQQSIVGTAHYKNDGSLISKSTSYIQPETEQNPKKINSFYVTPFKTPFSEVEMEIVIQSELNNINHTTNL
ncbi:MAG: hypothetical protein EA411_07135 [Saprospirales bacterium]|nr:MAG: hypothetical protein EA411_07135 [Saprospirales bacterium]